MNLDDFESFLEFAKEMFVILKEKDLENKDSMGNSKWKKCDRKELLEELEKQIKKFNFNGSIDDKYLILDKTKQFKRRKLLHISNYCFFLWKRLGDV